MIGNAFRNHEQTVWKHVFVWLQCLAFQEFGGLQRKKDEMKGSEIDLFQSEKKLRTLNVE